MTWICAVVLTNTGHAAEGEPLKAVKVETMAQEPPGITEQQRLKTEAVAMYRRQYGEWSLNPPQVSWRELGG